MANKKIPSKDKQIVIRRLAEGMSTREAIAGTVIKSNSTAAQLYRRESNAIEQHRADYLSRIEDLLTYGEIERAKLWADMTVATKHVPIKPPTDGFTPPKRSQTGYMEVPDWDVRYKALIYLDKLAGLHDDSHSPTNTQNNYAQIIKEQKISYGL